MSEGWSGGISSSVRVCVAFSSASSLEPEGLSLRPDAFSSGLVASGPVAVGPGGVVATGGAAVLGAGLLTPGSLPLPPGSLTAGLKGS